MKKLLSILLILILMSGLLSGCGPKEQEKDTQSNNHFPVNSESKDDNSDDNVDSVEEGFSEINTNLFTERDNRTEYDESKAVTIKLDKTSATASSNSVKISGSTITLTEEATYVISGELSDGMLIVNAPETAKLQLVFNGVSITSKTSAALYILGADKVFITLGDGTSNTLANGGSFTAIDDNNIDGALFSKQDLTLNGTGTLTVTSPAGHGVVCKDDLVITGGTYVVNSAFHGLDVNDSVRIANGNLSIDAGKDAIHAENTDDASLGFVYISGGRIHGEAEGDGIAAGAWLEVEDGTIDLLVGGGSENGSKEHSDYFGGFMGNGRPGGNRPGDEPESIPGTDESSTSMKGLKAANGLGILGGNITINSADDSVHSDTSLVINGGHLTIASGDDAIHAEDNLTVTAGKIEITECYEGLEALHIDVQGGDIKLKARDDGLNAAGGTDQSGITGGRDGMFGDGGRGGMGGHGGMPSNSNGSIQVSGGNLYINSSGDGMDANGTLEISGGHTVVVGPAQGDTATLDYDTSGVITGGTFVGTGAFGMAQTFSDSTQGVVAIRTGNQSSGTKIILTDKNGNTILEHTPELNFAVVILSTPDMKKGEIYTVTVGSQSGEFAAG